MKLRGLLIAIAVLAALTGALYWSNHHKPAGDSSVKASLESAPKILSLNQSDIVQISIQKKDLPALDLSRTDSGGWEITSPKPMTADQESMTSLLSTLSSLTSNRLVEEKASDLAPFGLANPALVLNITLKDKKSSKLLIGDEAPAGGSYYVMLAGDPRLFTLAGYDESSLDKSASDLRDRRLITADFDKVSQIDLFNQQPGKKGEITFERNKDSWQILKPQPYRADSLQVDDLIRTLKDAKLEVTPPAEDKKDAQAFQSAPPFAMAKIVGASGTQNLEVRKSKDDYYAKSSVLSGVYRVPATVGTGLDKSLDDFRNKKLFDFGYSDPDKIEIHDGAKAYFLTHSGSDWWGPDGKRMDFTTVDSLLDKLRDLSATKFPDSGFTTTTFQIHVVSNDKKRDETVQVAQVKDGYIARREGEPALYAVSDSAISELQKAAENLKPAAPPAPAKKK